MAGGRRLLRLFLGVGVLGGFTTFSGYVLDAHQMVAAGAARTALVYLAATVATALVAGVGRRCHHRLADPSPALPRDGPGQDSADPSVIRYLGRHHREPW